MPPVYTANIYSYDGSEIYLTVSGYNHIDIVLSETGCVVSAYLNEDFLRAYEYVYSGDRIFKGFAVEANGELVYTIGDSFSISSANINLYVVEEDPIPLPNKLVGFGNTIIDLTADTVTPETLGVGVTAHNAKGQSIVGTMEGNNGYTLAVGVTETNGGLLKMSTGYSLEIILTDNDYNTLIVSSFTNGVCYFKNLEAGTYRIYSNAFSYTQVNVSQDTIVVKTLD